MSDKKTEDKLDPHVFSIGHIGDPVNPDSLLINFPIARYAGESAEGMDMAYGKCRRIEAIVITLIKERFKQNQKVNGVIKPGVIGTDGKPMTVA